MTENDYPEITIRTTWHRVPAPEGVTGIVYAPVYHADPPEDDDAGDWWLVLPPEEADK